MEGQTRRSLEVLVSKENSDKACDGTGWNSASNVVTGGRPKSLDDDRERD
jgi:hypothetical protein